MVTLAASWTRLPQDTMRWGAALPSGTPGQPRPRTFPLQKHIQNCGPTFPSPTRYLPPGKGRGMKQLPVSLALPTVPSRIPRTQQGIRISALTEAPEVCSSSDFYQHLTPLLRWASGIRVYKIHMQPEQKEARELTGPGPFSSLSR